MSQHDQPQLSPADAAALDALVDAGFDLDAVAGDLRERAAAVVRLMGLLDALPDEPTGDLLVPRTMQFIERHAIAAAVGDVDLDDAAADTDAVFVESAEAIELATLSPDDAAAVDALVDAKFDLAAVPADHRERAGRAAALLGLLDALPEHRTGDLLVPRTLEAIDRNLQSQRFDQQISALAGGQAPRGGLRLSELGAVAAMFLIGLSVLWPMLSRAREDARQIACQANLSTTGLAFAAYSGDFNHALPATASRLGDSWWRTNQFNEDGTTLSNSAHLYVLVNSKYVKASDLACPSNGGALVTTTPDARDWPDMASVSYSYQNLATSDRPKLGLGPDIAVLADKNPFFSTAGYRFDLCRKAHNANSANHAAGVGQNVLMSDGAVQWRTSPRLDNDDNIYHVGLDGFDNYTGLEPPADESDSFLVP